MIRVFINGNLCTDSPIGVDDLTEDLTLSDDVYGYVYQIQGSLKFIGSDYDTIKALYDSDYCQDIPIEIQYSEDGYLWETKINGLIKLAASEFDLIRRHVTIPVTDNNYLSKINNNKNIKFEIGSEKDLTEFPILSKNGVDVTSKYVFHDNVQMFSPLWKRYFEDEGNFTDASNEEIDQRPVGRKGIFIYDALNLIIALMSDDEVGFASDYFTYDLTTPNNYLGEAFSVLISGRQLREGTSLPFISFSELYEDLHRLFNVWFAIEIDANGKPIIRIEPEEYFRGANSNAYFNDVETMIEKISLDKIYSKIVLGCSVDEASFPIEDVPFILHTQEEYGLSGTCNTDNTLDLRLRTLIINSNTICKSLPPLSGFNTGESLINKYSTEDTTAGVLSRYQLLNDTAADFEVVGIEPKYILHETLYDKWTYINAINSNSQVLVNDVVFVVDDPSTGIAKNYQIFKPSSDDGYDESVFLIQGDRNSSDATTFYALGTLITLPDIFYYNVDFANYKVIERHLGGISQDLIGQISDGNDEFNAGVIAADASFTTLPDPMYRAVVFDDDSTGPTYFDTNGNYENSTGFYIVPQGGYYNAGCDVNIRNASALGSTLIYQVELAQLSATNEIKRSVSEFQTITFLANYTFSLTGLFACDEGDKICVVVKRAVDTLNMSVSWLDSGILIRRPAAVPAPPVTSVFYVDALFNGGGVVPASTPNDVRIVDITSECSLSRDDFDGLISNPFKYYHVNYGENYKTGYIKSAQRGILSGKTVVNIFKKRNGV